MEISFEWGTTRISIRTFIIIADDTKVFTKVNTDGYKQHLQDDLYRLV